MTRRTWVIAASIGLFFLLCGSVTALPAFNQTEVAHYNQSYAVAVLAVTSTSELEWIVLAVLGIIFLIASTIGENRVAIDVYSILASMFLFIAAVKSFSIDTVTSYGTTHLQGTNEFVTMVNHTIYHYDIWGVVFGILFVLALGNQWRLWLDWHRVEEIEEDEEMENRKEDTQ